MALSGTLVWEVRTTGSSTNGGAFRGTALAGTPSAPSVSGSGAGGSVAANTYYVVLTYTPGGETRESPMSGQTSVTTTGTTSSITVTHPSDPGNGATWNCYVGTATGGPYFPQGTALAIGSNRVITTTPPTTGTQPPGVDYSQQDSAQFSLTTASAVHSTTTQINVAVGDHVVSANDVGNIYNNTGGTATVQRLEITAVDLVNNRWTVDKAAGTSAQTLTGNFGGAVDHPALPVGFLVDGHIVYVKYSATPYLFTTGTNVSGGVISYASTGFNNYIIQGYDVTRTLDNTDANRPILRANAASITLVSFNNGPFQFNNFVLDNPSANASTLGIGLGGSASRVSRCKFSALKGISVSVGGQASRVEDCEVTGAAITSSFHFVLGTGCGAIRCVVRSCTGAFPAFSTNTFGVTFDECIAYSNGGLGFQCANFTRCRQCVAYGNTGVGFAMDASFAEDCIAYGNTTYGFGLAALDPRVSLVNCRAGNNTTADIQTTIRSDKRVGFTHLSSDPFNSASGLDFTLNNVPGGGAACRGITTVFPNGTTTSYPDAGVAQHSDASVATYFSY